MTKLHSISEDWSGIENRWQYTLAIALVFLDPWVLLSSNVVFPSEVSLLDWTIIFVIYLAVLIVTNCVVNLVSIRTKNKSLFLGKLSNAIGALAAGLGLIFLCLGAAIDQPVISITGVILSGMGYALLMAIWFTPLARMHHESVTLVAFTAMLFAIVAYLLLSIVVYPYGSIIAACLYVIVPIVMKNMLRGKMPAPTNLTRSISHADAFVLQRRGNVYAYIGLSFFSIGYCIMMLYGRGIFFNEAAWGIWIVALCIVALLAITLWTTRHNNQSVLLFLLAISFAAMIIGVAMLAYNDLFMIGTLVLIVGFTVFSVFYLIYYTAICQLKGFSDVRSRSILGRTVLLFPISLFAAVAVYFLVVNFFEQYNHIVIICMLTAIVIVLLVMFYSELSNTRKELSTKTDSSVSLNEIMAFANGRGENYQLTDRECEIINLLMSGRSVRSASEELFLSENTIKTHIRSIYKKLNVHNRQEMIDKLSEELAN